MKIKYTKVTTPTGNEIIQAELDNAVFMFIPMDEANSDYQRYLNPEAEQSTPSVTNEAKAK